MDSVNIDQIKFSYFCKVCEKVALQKSKPKAAIVLQKFIDYVMEGDPPSFFPIMRLLLPHLDRERGAYGVKETNLARTYKRILGLPPNSNEYKILSNASSPSAITIGAMGDFGEVVSCILRNRCGPGGEITIGEVNNFLDNIALKHAQHDPRGVDDGFTEMVNRMSNEEQKWIVRIVIKSMNLGLGDKRIMGLYHPDAHEVYILTNNISRVCEKLKNRKIRYYELEIEMFQPFRPMLCGRGDVHNLSLNEPHYIETKMDGERFQLHYNERAFKYFSRNGYDYSDVYGDTPETGHFTSLIMKQLAPDLVSCILDGEMMGWHQTRKCFVQKAVNLDVKNLRVGSTVQPCFVVFDVIYYNGTVLTSRPLSERIETAKKVFTPLDGIIMHVSRSIINSNQDAFDSLNEAIDNNDEGIIIKQMNSSYVPNSRKDGWLKIKPDYSEGTEDLDLLIIGGYYGTGRKKGMICRFLLGVAEEHNGEPERFMSVARASSGISDAEHLELSNKLSPHWVKFKPSHPPPYLLLKREKPDVYILPRNSIILQVKSPEVVPTDAYYTGYTLRFVRVEMIRYDKPWYDCLKVNEFHFKRSRASGKLTSGHILPSGSNKRKRKFEPDQITTPPAKVNKKSELFLGKEICVLNGTKELAKEEIEKIIRENGGKVTALPTSSTFCIIYAIENVRVQNIIKAKKHNVAKFTWLLDCLRENKIIPWNKQNLVSMTAKTELALAEKFGFFEDNLEPFTIDTLKDVFQRMDSASISSESEVQAVDDLLFEGISPYSMFRYYYVMFDVNVSRTGTRRIKPSLKNAEMIFRFHGGVVCDEINELVSHIIFDENNLNNLQELKNISKEKSVFCQFISYKWIIDSFKKKGIVKEENYIISRVQLDEY